MTWSAYPGERAVLSGGALVTDWSSYRGGILKAPAPQGTTSHGKPRQLFYKGQRQRRSRWPKFDPENPITGGWIIPEGPVEEMECRALYFPANSFPRRWKKTSEAEANIYAGWGWCNNIIPILEIDHERRTLLLKHEPINEDQQQWYFRMQLGRGNRFFVENVLEELSEPGEWCHDSQEDAIYFWPPDREMGAAPPSVPVTDCLVRMRDAEWITLRGLIFTCTTTGDDYHRQGVQQGVGAMMSQQGWKYCGEALHIRGCRCCVVEECLFDQVGGNAIYLERDNHRIAVRYNEIDRSGFNGIVLVGDRVKYPRFCEVTDNNIHHIGRICNYVAGVFLGLSDSNVVAHNHIHDVPHHAVNLATNGIGRNYVEWNEIRRACQEISDTGAINSWGDVPFPWVEPNVERSGHFVRYNLIADTGGCRVDQRGRVVAGSQESRGIYLDDYTSNCLVWGNIILRSGTGVFLHGGKHNVVENNIIVGCKNQLWLTDSVSDRPGHEPMVPWRVGNRFYRNICVFNHSEAMIVINQSSRAEKSLHLDAALGQVDKNLYYHSREGRYTCAWPVGPESNSISFDKWQEMGFDSNSILDDPAFEDIKTDDYTLRIDSPAWKLGFTRIDTESIGIRKKQELQS